MSTQTLTIQGGVSVTAAKSNDVSSELLMKSFAGLYFNVIQEHSVSIQNQITDNYIENNTAVQDHIAQSPLVVSLRGLSGEVVYAPPQKALNWMYSKANGFIQDALNIDPMANQRILTDKLTAIPALLPSVDNVTQMAKNAVQYVEASVNRYLKIIKNFTDEGTKQTRLQQIYSDLLELRANNVLLFVETPYTDFSDMAIQSITLRQGNENYITDIELTLKQINFAQTQTTKPDTERMAIYNACARTEVENCGKVQGMEVGIDSLLSKLAPNSPAKIYKPN